MYSRMVYDEITKYPKDHWIAILAVVIHRYVVLLFPRAELISRQKIFRPGETLVLQRTPEK